jgi:hypothetical protein
VEDGGGEEEVGFFVGRVLMRVRLTATSLEHFIFARAPLR